MVALGYPGRKFIACGRSMNSMKNPTKKAKTTVYMTDEIERLLDEVFIKRIRDRRKTDKSALLCEGIRLLYEKEMETSNG